MKRALNILLHAVYRLKSPSLGRIVRVSDIWKTPEYLGGSITLIDVICWRLGFRKRGG